MGLDTSHDCWHGAYSSFMAWRQAIAKAAGYPGLLTMQGFGGNTPWDAYVDNPLTVLLSHSDADGEIAAADCATLADRLERLLPLLGKEPDYHPAISMYNRTVQFIAGLRDAASKGEAVDFH